MAGGRNKLVAPKIEKCSKPGYLNDGGNLYLQIVKRAPAKPGEGPRKKVEGVTKSWVFRYRHRVTKKLIELGLGSFPDISLQKARDKAASLREILHDRKDRTGEGEERKTSGRDPRARTCWIPLRRESVTRGGGV